MAKMLLGTDVSKNIRDNIKKEVKELKEQGIDVQLTTIIVGKDPASEKYIETKKVACNDTGIINAVLKYPEDCSEEGLINIIDEFNNNPKIHGILVQLPLPPHMDTHRILNSIAPEKDVDGFTDYNRGKLSNDVFGFIPCTPYGIMEILNFYKVDIEGKHCVIVGRSNIVGKPLANLMLSKNATVTICHSKTRNLEEFTKQADILIVAVGQPKLITSNMIKEGAVVIDVGINRDFSGRICGDVYTKECQEKASMITPVPGGVGPMTVTMLMANTVLAAKMQNQKE